MNPRLVAFVFAAAWTVLCCRRQAGTSDKLVAGRAPCSRPARLDREAAGFFLLPLFRSGALRRIA